MNKRLMQYGAAFAIVQLLSACGEGASAPVAETVETAATPNDAPSAATDTLIVTFGDSLFAGYQLDAGDGMAPVLEAELRETLPNARVFNAAVSGDTSGGGRARLAFVLDGLPKKPDLVIVELGGNDMLRGLPPAETEANLTAMLEELQRREIPAMLAGMLAAPNLGAEYSAAFNGMYPRLSKKFTIPLYPFVMQGVVGKPDLMLDDGIHPNADGVKVMADGLAPLVKGALGE